MAYEQNPYNLKLTFVCDPGLAAITNSYISQPMTQYSFVQLGTSNSVVNPSVTASVTALTANTQRPIGVLQNAPCVRYNQATGGIEGQDEAEVTLCGVVKVKAGGTIALGDPLSVTAAGLAQTVAVPSSTRYIVGTALSAGVSGDIITAVVDCSSAGRAA